MKTFDIINFVSFGHSIPRLLANLVVRIIYKLYSKKPFCFYLDSFIFV